MFHISIVSLRCHIPLPQINAAQGSSKLLVSRRFLDARVEASFRLGQRMRVERLVLGLGQSDVSLSDGSHESGLEGQGRLRAPHQFSGRHEQRTFIRRRGCLRAGTNFCSCHPHSGAMGESGADCFAPCVPASQASLQEAPEPEDRKVRSRRVHACPNRAKGAKRPFRLARPAPAAHPGQGCLPDGQLSSAVNLARSLQLEAAPLLVPFLPPQCVDGPLVHGCRVLGGSPHHLPLGKVQLDREVCFA